MEALAKAMSAWVPFCVLLVPLVEGTLVVVLLVAGNVLSLTAGVWLGMSGDSLP